ncbi:uncharacterized protein LY89DRAFT_597706 [Mollisia scopiformis]|uniref:Saponin hydrolase n=1 Tax=Mollisia scopiformis TaxID=149040 RepID=A0A132BBS5_MOLSC|nr:uncharacterized protein LY89DRAFT_597706 [Mollisia scopiformis]KUJ09831.1 hypothetical protein LY89DRAFT_597706 [Mollisia scopiformis]
MLIYRRSNTSALPLPPKPEPIVVVELPIPPVTADETEGGCTSEVNPYGTGCIGATSSGLLGGNFLPDGKHVTASLTYAGAPAAPDPASIYTGLQLITVKVDGTVFPNGDPWKCITCGVPADQQVSFNGSTTDYQYPQAFTDGVRVLAGEWIIDCGSEQLASPECTPDKVHIYPIRWNVTPDGSGAGGSIRELRKHPDDVHISFNALTYSGVSTSQFGYFARLQFNPSPTTGTPLTPRYDLVNVTMLYDLDGLPTISVDGNNLTINSQAIVVGEVRGLSGLGHQVHYIEFPAESCNIDIFRVSLVTGEVTRVTSDPEYVDPIDTSSDGNWIVIMDTTTTNRMMFLAGMRGIPPLIDTLITGAVSSVRNNGIRRFFQPWIVDRYGDRYYDDGEYYQGQQLNGAGDGSPGSVNDDNWNGMADPRWSLDGTRITYFQTLVQAPNCGGVNPLPCPNSTEPGGRTVRLMMATLTSRQPLKWEPVPLVSDVIPWGREYVPGSANPVATTVPAGNYTLSGNVSGYAEVGFIMNSANTSIGTVAATYYNYSDNGENYISGTEQVAASSPSATLIHVDWYSDLHSTGISNSSKITGPGGFHFEIDLEENKFYANGSLTTIVDGVVYTQPANGS